MCVYIYIYMYYICVDKIDRRLRSCRWTWPLTRAATGSRSGRWRWPPPPSSGTTSWSSQLCSWRTRSTPTTPRRAPPKKAHNLDKHNKAIKHLSAYNQLNKQQQWLNSNYSNYSKAACLPLMNTHISYNVYIYIYIKHNTPIIYCILLI